MKYISMYLMKFYQHFNYLFSSFLHFILNLRELLELTFSKLFLPTFDSFTSRIFHVSYKRLNRIFVSKPTNGRN